VSRDDSAENREWLLAAFTFIGIEGIVHSARRAHKVAINNARPAILALIRGLSDFDKLFI